MRPRGSGKLAVMLALWVVPALSAVGLVCAQAPSDARLLVLSKADLMLSVVDPVTLKVIGRVPSGPDPHEVAASADGRTAYVSNYGRGTGGFTTLTVADLTTFTSKGTIDISPLHGPHGMTTAGGKIYFTAEVSKAIGRVDPATNKVDWVLGTGRDITHMVVVASDLRRIFTVDVQSATASIIERAAGRAGRFAPAADDDWTVTSIKVGESAEDFEGFDVAPDGRELWTASPRGKVTIVDTVKKTVAQTFEAPISGANRVKFTPDGKRVLISRLSGVSADSPGHIVVFDAASRKEIKRIDAGGGVGGILMQPDGARAFGSSRAGVIVIDLQKLEVTGRIDAGGNPDGLAWTVKPQS